MCKVELRELLHIVNLRLDKRARRQALVINAIDDLRVNVTTTLPHELRTAIAIVESYTYLMLEDTEQFDPAQREMLEVIQANTLRLHRMADKYVWYVRACMRGFAKGNQETLFADNKISRICCEVAESFSRSNDLSLELEPVNLFIGEEYLNKIVEEIVENAFKFSSIGSPVSILGEVRDREYCLTVSDRGNGMTPDQIAHIGGFMQFDRDCNEQQGTGLGLITSKRLLEVLGGKLTIRCTDSSTNVSIRIPRYAINVK